MITKKIKRISSILEIIILYSFFLFIFFKTFKKYSILSLKYKSQAETPNLIETLHSKNDYKTISNNYITTLVKKLFSKVTVQFHSIFDIFHKIFKSYMDTIDSIRNLTKPIRTFFKNTTMLFYKKLQDFMIGISYSLHKIRNSLRRSVSGYNMAFHSLNHIYYSLQSILNSPIPKIVKKFGGVTGWLDKSFNKLGLCFDGDTYIDTVNGGRRIQDIIPGDQLDSDNFVISTHQFICQCDMYTYKNIIVSGSHLVKDGIEWHRIKNVPKSEKIDYEKPYIYCLSTTKGQIIINNILFKDYAESSQKLNNNINSIILSQLNNTKNIVNNYNLKYLEHGLDPNTLLKRANDYVKIKDVSIGDVLYNNIIIGIIKISPLFNHMFSYKDKWIFSNNTKINENGIWINSIDSIYSEPINDYKSTLYHLVTTDGIIMLENNLIIRDYLEIHDLEINNTIDKYVENYLRCSK
uniref:Hedgehog/Intein (Hint) domain-containing protein n=1 Tax=viral metagenome TaxID=1070528 RepID=A0A6C0EIP6_9ZZZZ